MKEPVVKTPERKAITDTPEFNRGRQITAGLWKR